MDKVGKLQGKVAIITGSGAGIGKSIAEAFAKEGARVVIADYNEQALKETVKEIKRDGKEAFGIKVDVADQGEVKQMAADTLEHFGTVDILVNNAGVGDNMQAAGNVEDEVWQRVMDINVTGAMQCIRAVLPCFESNQSGNIINMTSVAGVTGGRAGFAYTTAKHALVGMTQNVASHYGGQNIRSNAIAPGNIRTEFGSRMTNIDAFGMQQATRAINLIPRAGEAEEIAKVAVFLASDDSSYINGQTIVADGGWSAY